MVSERLQRFALPRRVSRVRRPAGTSGSASHAPAPVEFSEQRGSQVDQLFRRALQHGEDRLSVVDRECNELVAVRNRVQEDASCVVGPVTAEHRGELERLIARDTDAGDDRHGRNRRGSSRPLAPPLGTSSRRTAQRATKSAGGSRSPGASRCCRRKVSPQRTPLSCKAESEARSRRCVCIRGDQPVNASGLEPFALPPDVLLEEHGAKLLQAGRGILECAEDHVPFVDFEGEDMDVACENTPQRRLKVFVVDPAGELEDEPVGNVDACEEHCTGDRTRVRFSASVCAGAVSLSAWVGSASTDGREGGAGPRGNWRLTYFDVRQLTAGRASTLMCSRPQLRVATRTHVRRRRGT